MNETCVGGGARRLVDARFMRALDGNERNELETHLASCGWCSERYRRMQLAERVASVGPERAFEEPSALEIERIAQDLQLVDRTVGRFAWWREARGAMIGFGAALAVAAAAAMFFFVQPSNPTPREAPPVMRGAGEVRASFSLFAINAQGAVRPYQPGTSISAAEVVKLRASWSGAELNHVAVAIVDASGNVRVAQLGAPKGSNESATIPGAVSLAGSATGEATTYIIASETPLADDALRDAVGRHPGADELRTALKAIAVDRRTITIEP